MEKYSKYAITWGAIIAYFVTGFLVADIAAAKQGAPLRAKIVFPADEDKVYDLDNPKDAISLNLLLKNVSGSDVWTQEGFDDQNFQSFLFIYGPLGKDARLITSASSKIGGSPTPSVAPEKIAVEELNARMPPKLKELPWAKKISIQELRNYYKLTQPGEYKLWFAMSFVQYDPANLEVVKKNKNDKKERYFVPFNDRLWSGVIEFKEEYITLKSSTSALKSNIRVTAEDSFLGKGIQRGVKKPTSTSDGFVLRLYSRLACEAIYGAVGQKTFGAIANDAQLNSEAVVGKPVSPDKKEYIFKNVKQADWVIIGNTLGVSDHQYLWAMVKADDPRWGKKDIYIKLELMTDQERKAFIEKIKK